MLTAYQQTVLFTVACTLYHKEYKPSCFGVLADNPCVYNTVLRSITMPQSWTRISRAHPRVGSGWVEKIPRSRGSGQTYGTHYFSINVERFTTIWSPGLNMLLFAVNAVWMYTHDGTARQPHHGSRMGFRNFTGLPGRVTISNSAMPLHSNFRWMRSFNLRTSKKFNNKNTYNLWPPLTCCMF